METQVKTNVNNSNGKEQLRKAAEAHSTKNRKGFPQRGKRYSPAMKNKILKCAAEGTIKDAATTYDVADRFYGIVERSLKRIEQGLGADTAELTCPDSRGLDLFMARETGLILSNPLGAILGGFFCLRLGNEKYKRFLT